MALYELDGMAPRVATSAWVAENAQVIGDVQLGRAIDDINQKTDLAQHCGRHLFGHPLKMPLDKHYRDNNLHCHHRQNQDQSGAPIKPARHEPFDPAPIHDKPFFEMTKP